MCQFLETIRLENGIFSRLNLHQQRMSEALISMGLPLGEINISLALNDVNPPVNGLFKCRVLYETEIRSIEFIAYHKPLIYSLKLLETDLLSSHFKLANREPYRLLMQKKGFCDDVLLVRNGLITDTSFCNVALYDGLKWVTPANPLIYGVNRSELLAKGMLVEKDIPLSELKNYSFISLFNAMNEHMSIVIPVINIQF